MAAEIYKKLQEKLGCSIEGTPRVEAALTHSSMGAAINYERLEFLGDRVLGLVMAQILYETFPDESEGGMAKRHDAGIAEDEIERERKQREPGNLGEDQVVARQQVDRRERGKPEQVFGRMPARSGGEMPADVGDQRGR